MLWGNLSIPNECNPSILEDPYLLIQLAHAMGKLSILNECNRIPENPYLLIQLKRIAHQPHLAFLNTLSPNFVPYIYKSYIKRWVHVHQDSAFHQEKEQNYHMKENKGL